MDALRLFDTPVLVLSAAEAGLPWAELRDRLVAESLVGPSVHRSNGGGAWHSTPDLAQRPEACFQGLIRRVVELACDVTVERLADHGVDPPSLVGHAQAWAVVSRRGGYAMVHDHADAHWSAVYYADAGDDPVGASGALALLDPRRATASIAGVPIDPTTFTIRPQTGMLVLFPGWLQHFAHPYAGDRPRVVVSVNVRLAPS